MRGGASWWRLRPPRPQLLTAMLERRVPPTGYRVTKITHATPDRGKHGGKTMHSCRISQRISINTTQHARPHRSGGRIIIDHRGFLVGRTLSAFYYLCVRGLHVPNNDK